MPKQPLDRTLMGTWCTPKLEKAVSLGYQIRYIHEVWHCPETFEGLFADYTKTWVKIKPEARDWPDWVGDDDAKRK